MVADLHELRAEYIFALGHVCHVSPADLDRMKLKDFFQLVQDIDAYIEAKKKSQEG